MGWTFSYKPASQSATDYLRKKVLDCENEHGTWKTLAASQVGNTVYAAVERVKVSGERYVFAAVILTKADNRSAYNFGWKDIDESSGPYRIDCPERILKLLTPTDNENANQWRLSCREKRQQWAARKKFLSTIKPGMLLSFADPFTFRIGGEKIAVATFALRDMKRRLFVLPEHGNLLVRLRKDSLARSFEVIDAAQYQETRLAA